MMNLLGCNKEDFYSLMLSMNYKKVERLTLTFILVKLKKEQKFIDIKKTGKSF